MADVDDDDGGGGDSGGLDCLAVSEHWALSVGEDRDRDKVFVGGFDTTGASSWLVGSEIAGDDTTGFLFMIA